LKERKHKAYSGLTLPLLLREANRTAFFLQGARGTTVAGSVIASVSVRELTEWQIEVFGASWYYFTAMAKGHRVLSFDFSDQEVT